jgi:hypothetical protein
MLKIVGYLPNEKLAELGRWSVSNFSRDFVWEVFKEISLDTLIKSYEVLSTEYDKLFTFEHQKVGQEHTLKILHSRGPKWSRSSVLKACGSPSRTWGPMRLGGVSSKPILPIATRKSLRLITCLQVLPFPN